MPHTPQTAVVRLLQSVTDARNIAPGDRVGVSPQLVVLGPRDGLAALKAFRLGGGDKVANADRFLLFTDNNLPAADEVAANTRKQLIEAAKQAGLTNTRPGAGCEIATILEEALVVPGEVCVSNLPEVGSLGGIGALGLRVTVRDVAAMMAGEALELTVPHSVRVNLTGDFPAQVGGREVFWSLRREMESGRLTGGVLEIGGAALEKLSLHDRAKLALHAAHEGVFAAFCVPDRVAVQELNQQIKRPYQTTEPEKGAGYRHSADVDVAHAQLGMLLPGGEDWRSLGEAAGDPVSHVILGGRGSLGTSDLNAAAEIIKQRKLGAGVRLDVIPNSREVYRAAISNDLIGHLIDAGANIHPPGTMPESLLGDQPALVTTLTAERGCMRAGVISAATAACAAAIVHPERLDAQPQRDSKLSGRRKPI